MTIKKRVISFALALMMCASAGLVSCSKGGNGGDGNESSGGILGGLFGGSGTKAPTLTKRTNVYNGEDIYLPEDIGYINKMAVNGEMIYVLYEAEVEHHGTWDEYNQFYGGSIDEGNRVDEIIAYDSDVMMDTAEIESYGASVLASDDMVAIPEENSDEAVWYEWYNCLYITDLTGNYRQTIKFDDLSQNANVSNFVVDKDNNVYVYVNEWMYNEDYTSSSNVMTLVKYDISTGKAVYNLDINAIVDQMHMFEEGDYIYVNNLGVMDGNKIVCQLENGIVIFDTEGNPVAKSERFSGWFNGLFTAGSDIYVTGTLEGGSANFYKLNPQTEKFEAVQSDALHDVVNNAYGYMTSDEDGVIYFRSTSGLSKYDFKTDKVEEVFNYINNDVDTSNVSNITRIADGRIITCGTDWSGEKSVTSLSVYTRIPDEEIKEEQIISLACTYTDYNLRKAIIAFNKKNTGVRVSVVDYESYNNESNEWKGAVTQLNNDIVTGKLSDIVVLSSQLPVNTYISKGIFVDLAPYIDGDNGIDRSKLLENVLAATTDSKGKTTSIILQFYIQTLAARSEYVGNEEGVTLAQFMDIIEKIGENSKTFVSNGRDTVLDNMLHYATDAFIDWENGKTSFDSPEFVRFIKYLATLPEQGYWEAYYQNNPEMGYEEEEGNWQNWDMRYYLGNEIFFQLYMSDVNAASNAYRTLATDDVTFLGYPTNDENSNGATIVPEIELAISSSSSNKDAAWSFIKYLMTDETFATLGYEYSINKAQLEDQKQKTLSGDYYHYEYTEEDFENYLQWYTPEYVDYLRNTNRKLSEADLDKTIELVKGTTRVARENTAVMDIIKEELSGFFGGTKTAEDTAKVIGSRVSIYVSENS